MDKLIDILGTTKIDNKEYIISVVLDAIDDVSTMPKPCYTISITDCSTGAIKGIEHKPISDLFELDKDSFLRIKNKLIKKVKKFNRGSK